MAQHSVQPRVNEVASGDGRRVRRERNRDAVVDAMLQLYRDGNLAPSSDEIALRAGLSPRSLFRYFDDIDDLIQSAISRQLEHVRPTLTIEIAADEPVAQRVAALIDQRLRMFDAMAAVGQVARLREPFQPLVADMLAQARSFFRLQIDRLFAAEFAAMGHERAAQMLAAIDVVTSFEGYRLMREDQGLSTARAAETMVAAVTELVTLRS